MKLLKSMFTFLILLASGNSYAQIDISGSSCVLAKTEYDYVISSDLDSSLGDISICINGGYFVDTKMACQTFRPPAVIKVLWNDNIKNGDLTISTSVVAKTLQISIATPLEPGEIIASSQKQTLKYDSASAEISCSPATGGSCSATYIYQWQQSADALYWSDIDGAKNISLPSYPLLKEPVFYRRKVTETVSGTIGYSTIATVFVDADYKSK